MRRTFVVGFPRSGTTLVQSILGGHPDVATFPETHFFESVVLRWWPVRWTGLVRPDAIRTRARLRDARVGWLPGPADLVRPGLGRWSHRFAAALDAAARDAGAGAWIEKTPGHYAFIPEITRHVAGASFVHVLRPGLSAIASYHRAVTEDPAAWGGQKFWFDLSPMGLARRWADAVSTTLAYVGDDRHHVIGYDDVVRAPAEVARGAFAWMGLDSSEETVRAALRDRTTVAAGVVLGRENWKSENTREIRRRVSGEWVERVRSALTPPMLATIAELDARITRLTADPAAARADGASPHR